MATGDNNREHCHFNTWMSLQGQELNELVQLSEKLKNNNDNNNNNNAAATDAEITQLLDKITHNFEEYCQERRLLARRDHMAFFAPAWCSALEKSMMWIGGCRPSSFFNLIFALSGHDIEAKLAKFFQGDEDSGFPHLSPSQQVAIDKLQRETIHEEDGLTSKMALLHQQMSDNPLACLARNYPVRLLSSGANQAILQIGQEMVSCMEEADELRLNTFKAVIDILRPVQALDYMIAAKKLRFFIQICGVRDDLEHGRE